MVSQTSITNVNDPLLALAKWEIEMILSVSRRPRRPRQVQYWLSSVAITGIKNITNMSLNIQFFLPVGSIRRIDPIIFEDEIREK